jgi:hypothetical protein
MSSVAPTVPTPVTDDGAGSPTVRARLRANRGLLLIGVLVVLASVLLGLARSSRAAGLLDPDATDPSGSHALATLLREQGVTVVRVTDTTAAVSALRLAPDATLVVAPSAPVSVRMAAAVGSVAFRRLVLVAPDPATLDVLAPWAVLQRTELSTDEVQPDCSWDVALRAGALPPTGLGYSTTRTDADVCWGGAVIDAPPGDGLVTTTVLGSSPALTNASLADSGNAAMALGVLGRTATVVWWLPSATDPLALPAEQQPGIEDLVPSWVGWALLQLALAMLVVVWWRGRRLGRVVVEPLPVVVRATESVEGRARLYRRGHARGVAADALREAALARLRTRLSLPRGADPQTVVAAVAARTGRTGADLTALLAPGLDPTDDAGLTRLVAELDTLENEVRRS